jgi:hypothetical protein
MKRISLKLLFIASFGALVTIQGCRFFTDRPSGNNESVSLIGSWEGTDTTVNADYKIVVQFQSDSLFQEFGSYEGEWKVAGVWEFFTSNGQRQIKLTYEESKNNPLFGMISYLSEDSLFIEFYDEFQEYVSAWSLNRTKSEDGLYVMSNPIFKLNPYNPESESDVLTTSPAKEIPSTDLAPPPSRTIQKQWILCSDCHGIGKDMCGRCNGARVEECRRCYGSGVIDKGTIFSPDTDGRGHTCPECAGRGSKMCSSCRGTGNTGECSACGGRGQVLYEY